MFKLAYTASDSGSILSVSTASGSESETKVVSDKYRQSLTYSNLLVQPLTLSNKLLKNHKYDIPVCTVSDKHRYSP